MELTVNEFRIGNLVWLDDEILPIWRLCANAKATVAGEPDMGDFECRVFHSDQPNTINPIELTKEWLTKFGFHSKYKSVHVHWHKTYGFGPPPYRLFELDQKSNVDDDNNSIPQEQVFYWDSQLEVKYVHQLQNLYFALTEEELIVI